MRTINKFLFLMFLLILCLSKISAKSLDDGVYIIKSVSKSSMVIDLKYSDVSNGSIVQLYKNNNGDNQLWALKKTEDGYYSISSILDYNKVLDIPHASNNPGINVQLYSNNKGDNQQWKFVEAEDGYYYIVSKCNNLNLSISKNVSQNSANIEMATPNNADSQKFKLEKVWSLKRTIEDGNYIISSAVDTNKVLDIYKENINSRTNIEIYSKNSNWNQIWKIEYLNNGYYKIVNALKPKYALDVYGKNKQSGTNVQLYEYTGGDNQQWVIQETEDGNYKIISKLGNVALDLYRADTTNGTNIQIYKSNNTNAQKFKLKKVWESQKTIEDGNYIISSLVDTNKVLDIYSGEISNKVNIEVYDKNSNWNQIWKIEYLNNGYYKIANAIESKYVLDVYAANKNSGTNVELYEYNGGDNQQWAIKELEDGNYKIISKLGNVVLDLCTNDVKNKTNVQIFTSNDNNSQKFLFEKISAVPLKDGLYKIANGVSNSSILTIENNYIANNANIITSNDINSNGQKWYIKYIKNGYYSISSAFNSNYLIDVGSGMKTDANNVQLYRKNNSDGQLWYIKYVDGNYTIFPKNSSKVLSVELIEDDNATSNAIIENNEHSDNQKFTFEETEIVEEEVPNYGNATLIDGYYTISSSLNSSYSLDVHGAYKFNATNVELYNLKNSINQIWHVTSMGNGYYSITSAMNPNLSLDVANNSNIPGTNIQIYKKDNSAGQLWMLKDTGDGNITIVSKLGNLAVDLNTINVSNNTNVILNELTYTNTQKFKFNKYDGEKKYKGIDVSSHNGYIDWEKAAKDIDFAILRLGYGGGSDGGDDSQFVTNVKACEDYNIPYGVYLYSYALNSDIDTKVEIEHVSNSLKYANPNLGTKVFFDMEDADGWKKRHGIYDNNQLLNTITNKFCAGVESLGLSCGIYANVDWLTNKLNAQELAKKYTIWVAIWPDNANINSFSSAYNLRPAYNLTTYNYWQFTSNGRINGISGTVDLDLGYDIFD